MSDEAQEIVSEFLEGFYERVEYTRGTTGNLEVHVEARWQRGLVDQLHDAAFHKPANGEESGGGGKPKSKPPCNLEILDLADACLLCATQVLATGSPIVRLRKLRRQARLLLGYEAPLMVIKDTVCGVCGGALSVARDASTSVRCIGTDEDEPCGNEYPQHTWISLLDGGV